MTTNFTDKIDIPLANGCVMEIQMTETLVNNIRSAFSLSSWENLTPNHVKFFLAKSMQNALESVSDEK